jgi:hypothetical protein
MAIVGTLSIATTGATVKVRDAVTPPDIRFGWAGESVAPEPVADDLLIVGAEPSEGVVSLLWDAAKKVNGGNHLPCYRQETGDCTSWGAFNALNYRQCFEAAQALAAGDDAAAAILTATNNQFRYSAAFPPWIYGVSRTAPDLGNHKLRGAGSLGSWTAQACVRYGVLSFDEPDLPKYSGKLADTWGRSGPPKEWFPKAEPYKLRSVALVQNYEAARDALANGFPVTVASNQGFQQKATLIDGRYWGRPSGSWAHQMCFTGVDDTAPAPPWSRSKKPGAVYCQNSWGATAHGTENPPDGAPPGGFWVDRDTADRMLGQRDSYAYSGFEGFVPKRVDWSVFAAVGPDEAPAVETVKVVSAYDQPEAKVALCEAAGVSSTYAGTSGLAMVVGSLVAVVAKGRRRRRQADLAA